MKDPPAGRPGHARESVAVAGGKEGDGQDRGSERVQARSQRKHRRPQRARRKFALTSAIESDVKRRNALASCQRGIRRSSRATSRRLK